MILDQEMGSQKTTYRGSIFEQICSKGWSNKRKFFFPCTNPLSIAHEILNLGNQGSTK
jgi:hypothetical protein